MYIIRILYILVVEIVVELISFLRKKNFDKYVWEMIERGFIDVFIVDIS